MGQHQGQTTDARRGLNTKPTEKRHQEQSKLHFSSLDITLKLGWDQANRQSVALKTFRTDPSTFPRLPGSLPVEYEIKSMDRVTSHRNIVRLVEVVVRSPSNVCLVMEAAAASRGDLMETIAAAPGGRLRPDTARFYLGQLLDAVQHCHSKGVCHRDIQPHNLLVDPRSGNMKLSNFSRAGVWHTTAGDATDLAYAPSTALLAHPAPEVLEGPRYCGKAADCWSVGATLFTMLAGFSPVTTDDAQVEGYDMTFPSWICPLARSLLEGIMEPDAEKRHTIAEIRSHPWFVLKRCASGGDGDRDHGSSPSPSSRYSTSTSSISTSTSTSTSDAEGV